MDHQVLTESYRNHAQRQDWNLPVHMTEEFGATKLEMGLRSYYQDDHFQDLDERKLGCVKYCPDLRQQQALRGLKRDRRNSGSGMQAVFLSGSHLNSHSTKGSVGTGVFLPHGTRDAMERTKKSARSGCSTVLLPAGVIQALKLHFDRMERQSHCHSNTQQCSCNCGSPPQRDAMANNRNGYDDARQRLRFHMDAALWSQDSDDSNEGLPQEWAY